MEILDINCEKRELGTKGQVRALRRTGKVPAIVYGRKRSATPIAVAVANLKASVTTDASQRLLKLKAAESDLDGRHVIIKDVQRAPISGDLLHADLYEVDLTAKLQVTVPLRFQGRPKGVADGGILQPLVRTIDVECLPTDIPESIDVDVTELGIHDVIHISALKFGPNITPVFDSDIAIVTVLPPTVEAAPVAAEVVPEEGAAAAPAEGGEAATPAAGEAAKGETKKGETAGKK
ncbi:MAG TPA: 50S ribosomal protein L25 [Candidatus Binataceae bacterium]|jgi:large subunit ribosomal protein L25|nr:50S ribosomal protein L25 [Candidatus Binataceae bacterium]